MESGSGGFSMRMLGRLALSATFSGWLVVMASGALTAGGQQTAPNEWTWVGGSSTIGCNFCVLPGVYGTLRVPAPGNIPGARSEGSSWTDKNGKLWLFGGEIFTTGFNYFNDLWEFDPVSNEWTWMGGSSTVSSNCPIIAILSNCGQPGVYGTLGTPSPGNAPGGRYSAVSWTDASGHFWIFGGEGFDGNGSWGALNDMWEYDPSTSEWTWMGGSDTVLQPFQTNQNCEDAAIFCGQPAVYGTLGSPSTENIPGGLWDASSWTDGSGNLWLFGGSGWGAQGNAGELNVLWRFTPITNEWAWMSGSTTVPFDLTGQLGVYGTVGVAAVGNVPGGRLQTSTWTGGDGSLWLFGGRGYDSAGNFGDLNDLWEFNPASAEWTWVTGSDVLSCVTYGQGNCDQPGVYGTLGVAASGNTPGSRAEASSWTDAGGNLWLFGGTGYDAKGEYNDLNDLWVFIPATHEWMWMGGHSNATGGGAAYGTLGMPAAGNDPGIRDGAMSWTDGKGNFWLFGGHGVDAADVTGYLNDLWVYQPSASTNLPTASFSITGTSVSVAAGATTGNTSTVTLTPANGFTGSIALTAAITSSPANAVLPPTLSFGTTSPVSISGTTAGTATLTISTTASSSPGCTGSATPQRSAPWYFGGAALACISLIGIPGRRRSWRTMIGMAGVLVALVSGVAACGGSGGGMACPNVISAGTTAGVYVITVTGMSGSITETGTVQLTVE